MDHVIVIGNGISGVTAARHIRKLSNVKITIISEEHPYFFSRTALMYVFMGHMTFSQTQPYENWFWKKNNIDLIQSKVININPTENKIELVNGTHLAYSKLIVATGSKYNTLNCPGIDLKGVSGLYHKKDLEYISSNTKNCKHAVVVGGGLIGIELVEMLLSRGIKVSFIVRENSFWNNNLTDCQSELINNHIISHHVDLRLNKTLKSIEGESGKVKNVTLNSGEKIECQFVGITIGVSPNIAFVKNSGVISNKGIIVDEFLTTNFKNIFAIGDCAEHQNPPPNRPVIESIWYSGRKMGETVAKTICNSPTKYNPGHWFNSAKFLDIEYQIYGLVNNSNSIPKDHQQIEWIHESKPICFTAEFNQSNKQLLGISALGMRLRQNTIHKWIDENRNIEYALEHLQEIFFDSEFYPKYDKQIILKYNSLFNGEIKIKPKKMFRIFNI